MHRVFKKTCGRILPILPVNQLDINYLGFLELIHEQHRSKTLTLWQNCPFKLILTINLTKYVLKQVASLFSLYLYYFELGITKDYSYK